jgi:hypothetical protein
VSTVIDTLLMKMSTLFDTASGSVYPVFMFAERVRRAVQAVTSHVDVFPDTLILRAMEPASAGRAEVTTRHSA